MEYDMACLKIDIARMKDTISHAFMLRNKEIQSVVDSELEKLLSERNIVAEIRVQINKALDNAIKELSASYKIRSALTTVMEDFIANCISAKENANE